MEHKTTSYPDGFKQVVYCRVCSAEGDDLLKPCPGKYVGKDAKDDKKPVEKS